MELTPKAVKSLLSRARLNLKEALKAYIYMDQGFGEIRSEEA
jgi:DNA-directed RNA polymerase specialized sigma24 family protein